LFFDIRPGSAAAPCFGRDKKEYASGAAVPLRLRRSVCLKMRIAIREQLAAVVILTVGVALAIVSIPVWVFVNSFVGGVESDGLSLTASLKAARIASEINLIQTACQTISTRLLLQDGFTKFYNSSANNETDDDPWTGAQSDIESALSRTGFSGLLQARLYSRNTTGDPKGLFSITGNGARESGRILLPYAAPNGSQVHLGDPEYGFPPSLYPNITYRDLDRPNEAMPSTNAFSAAVFPGVSLGNGSEKAGVLLGPLVINSTFALLSITIPVRDVKNTEYIIGYMTLVANSKTLVEVQNSVEGLGSTGIVLFIGSVNPWNHFSAPVAASNRTWVPPLEEFRKQEVQFLLPPQPAAGQRDRHNHRSFGSGRYSDAFALHQYPAVLNVLSTQNP
jgi:osomolarity two-component system sensor histidine kinase SLN1